MKLEYDVIRSNRRTIGITVERDRRVVVRAPLNAKDERVSQAVAKKRFWIWQKIRNPHKYESPVRKKDFVPGEGFLFLGENYPLELLSKAFIGVRFNGQHFALSRDQTHQGRLHFRHWYTSQAKTLLSPRVAVLAESMGLKCNRIGVRDLRYRWGSCSFLGTVTFNWRIIQAPTVVVDYLIVHELAHVIHPNHSPDFWNIVAVHAPAWQNAREWLRRHGAHLEW